MRGRDASALIFRERQHLDYRRMFSVICGTYSIPNCGKCMPTAQLSPARTNAKPVLAATTGRLRGSRFAGMIGIAGGTISAMPAASSETDFLVIGAGVA